MAAKTTKASKTTKNAKSRKAKTAKTGKVRKYVNRTKPYSGAPIKATRLYSKKLGAFTNTEAHHLIAVNNDAGTVTHMNTYRGGILPASYNSDNYTYPIKDEKKLEAKLAEFEEIERTEWPDFVTSTGKRRKAAK